MSAGYYHSALLRSDGRVASTNCDRCSLAFRNGVSCKQVSAGEDNTIMLLCDGSVVAWDDLVNEEGEIESDGSETLERNPWLVFPTLEDGVTYVQVSSGRFHTVLIRSDGGAVACGENSEGQCNIPALETGVTYVQAAAGGGNAVSDCAHTVLLRSDGLVVGCGYGVAHMLPEPREGVVYTQVSTGECHTVLLRADGIAEAYSSLDDQRIRIPPLCDDKTYVQVSAGGRHTVLLRSDGIVVACGDNDEGQCDIPALREADEEVTYVQVSAGGEHTLLLRSDGRAVACGSNVQGQCDIPESESVEYVKFPDGKAITKIEERSLQIRFERIPCDFVWIVGTDLSGSVSVCIEVSGSSMKSDLLGRLAAELEISCRLLRAVLPDGNLLTAKPSEVSIDSFIKDNALC